MLPIPKNSTREKYLKYIKEIGLNFQDGIDLLNNAVASFKLTQENLNRVAELRKHLQHLQLLFGIETSLLAAEEELDMPASDIPVDVKSPLEVANIDPAHAREVIRLLEEEEEKQQQQRDEESDEENGNPESNN
ncbi:hypothetical protein KR074_009301 [Drosophila pseudoananassae]|nr:hypothetical protein KR074_009301 [Drosophila pseudoananassae]